MKKAALIAVAAIVALAGAAAFIYREQIGMALAFQRIKPDHTFAAGTRPAEPDYSQMQNWAALPDRDDAADALPGADAQDNQASAAVDVFFVHPTTYYETANWNQPLDNARANQMTDLFVMRGQAAVFNSCCKIHAPRYRQATLYSFMDTTGDGARALDVAYADVERAFDYFLEHFNQGRPFVLASHSQGSLHLRKLLEERISGTELRDRMVAAYPIGFSLDREAMGQAAPDIPVCESAEQLGCMVSWNAVGPNASAFGDPARNVCVNPLTWRADGEHAAHDLNLGSVTYPGAFTGQVDDIQALPQEYIDGAPIVETGVADAHCVNGMLLVSEIRSSHYEARPLGRDNYHVYDYSLFHVNLRRNVEAKTAHYLAMHAPAAAEEE